VHIAPHIPQMQSLGFKLLGCYDCGEVVSDGRSIVGYFLNRRTNDFANVSLMMAPGKVASYFEFSARLANGQALETNTNEILPQTPDHPEIRVFRFPKIREPRAQYELHRQLVEMYADGLCVQGEPKGHEIQRLVRIVENYGVRHTKSGYMYLADRGEHYRLTWKGAALMAWRALWPTALVRTILHRQAMQAELESLQVRGTTVWHKA
jgi:hypothetical protein